MKYISEERLETLLNNTSYITANDLLRVLINECKELNQWQPIDTAPKDREIVVFAPGCEGLNPIVTICKWHGSAGFCIDELRQPTHWMEKHELPK